MIARKLIPLLVLASTIVMGGAAVAEPPGAFDYYLLEQSWLPEFCAGTVARKPTKMPHPECKDVESRYGALNPTVHGLWPQNDGDDYPSSCNGSPGCDGANVCELSSKKIADPLEKELDEKWMPGYPNLAEHEWKKHGTCSGLDQDGYFSALAAVAAKVPATQIPSDRVGGDVDLAELRTWWGEPRAAFLCDRRGGVQYLAAVRTCWERADDMKPGNQFDCPSILGDTCSTKQKVRIARATNLAGLDQDVTEAGGGVGKKGCTKPGQGPACKVDATCKEDGWLRCAKSSGCCTNVPK